MNSAEQFKMQAASYAHAAEARRAQIVRQIKELEERLRELRASEEAAAKSGDWLLSYNPDTSRDVDCPHCWILGGKRSRLKPLPSQGEEDLFACTSCELQFAIVP